MMVRYEWMGGWMASCGSFSRAAVKGSDLGALLERVGESGLC